MDEKYVVSIWFETGNEGLLRFLQGWKHGLLEDSDLVEIIAKILENSTIWDIELKKR